MPVDIPKLRPAKIAPNKASYHVLPRMGGSAKPSITHDSNEGTMPKGSGDVSISCSFCDASSVVNLGDDDDSGDASVVWGVMVLARSASRLSLSRLFPDDAKIIHMRGFPYRHVVVDRSMDEL